jgi:hypothetical protein
MPTSGLSPSKQVSPKRERPLEEIFQGPLSRTQSDIGAECVLIVTTSWDEAPLVQHTEQVAEAVLRPTGLLIASP